MKISATLIALNEENNLPRAISSIKDLADETILVIDPRSTDKTKEVAEKLGAKVFTREFDDFANQKNFAIGQAQGNWVLSLDCDEEIPGELASEIRKAVKLDQYNAYLIPRRNILLGREIKHTRWSPDKHIWLFKRKKGKWRGKVHEEVVVDGMVGELKNAKIHYSYESVSEFLKMMNRYTDLAADEMVEKGQKFSYFMLFLVPTLSFFRRFFYKKGFLDGWRGFVLSYLMAIYRMVTWIKVWERSRGS